MQPTPYREYEATLLPLYPENRCWHVGYSPVDCDKQCSRYQSVFPFSILFVCFLMDGDTLRYSRLKILDHMSVLNDRTLGTSLAWLPRDGLIQIMVTVLLAPDPGFERKTWVKMPLVLLLHSSALHVASYLTCDLLSPSIKWDNTHKSSVYSI